MMRTCEMAKKLDQPQKVAERISASQRITDADWRILARLFSTDLGYDKERVAKYAIDTLRKTMDGEDAPESHSYLREVLVDHRYYDAREF